MRYRPIHTFTSEMTEAEKRRVRTQELRRLWEVEVFVGDPDEDETTTTETVVAMNAVEAVRKAGRCAAEPKDLGYVTYDDPPRFIENPNDGPTDEIAEPTITDD